jgi:predicted nucleic acid-binding protein
LQNTCEKDQNKNKLSDINIQSNAITFDKKLINLTSETNRKYTIIKLEWQIKVTL